MFIRLEFNDGESPKRIVLKPDLTIGVVRFDPIGGAKGFLIEAPVGLHRKLLFADVFALLQSYKGQPYH